MRVVCYWSRTSETRDNFGDALNPFLVNAITGKSVSHYNDCNVVEKFFSPLLFCIGSILERDKRSFRYRRGDTHIWGTGTRGDNSLGHLKRAKIHAVRGPLTRKKLLESGIACPEVYGDPAILLPEFMDVSKEKKFKFSIMPHYDDYEFCKLWLREVGLEHKVHIINPLGLISDVVSTIAASEFVLSSSLHGLIVSDAYGVPSGWIEFGKVPARSHFKYQDYFLSVDKKVEKPVFSDDKRLKELDFWCESSVLGNVLEIQKVREAFPQVWN